MNNKVGIIINPNAKANSRQRNLKERLEAIIGDHGMVRVTREMPDLYKVAEEFIKKKVEILGISGGDGTMQKTISRYIEVGGEHNLPKIAAVRGGTMNTIANSMQIKGSTEGIISRIMDKIRNRKNMEYKEIDLMKADRKEYGSLFGIGLSYNFLDAYYEGGTTGPCKAVQVIGHCIGSVMIGGAFSRRMTDPVKAKVYLDGRQVPIPDISAVLACTISDIGLGFKPLYRAEEKEGYFHSITTGLGASQIVMRIHKLFLGMPIRNDLTHDDIGRDLRIEPEEDTVKYMLDGELFTHEGPLQLQIGPRIQVVYA
jgi:diacylglycerol kinase family enzyme